MSFTDASREHLLVVIEKIKVYYDESLPFSAMSGAGSVPGGLPSSNPQLCYKMWSLSAFPLLFEDVSHSDMEDAFDLWSQELGQTIAEDTSADDIGEEDSLSCDDVSYESSSSDEEYTSGDSSGAESERASSGAQEHPSYPTTASPAPCYALTDVETGSRSSEPDDGDDDTTCYRVSEASDASLISPLGLASFYKAPDGVDPPSPSVQSTDDFSFVFEQESIYHLDADPYDLSVAVDCGQGDAYAEARHFEEIESANTAVAHSDASVSLLDPLKCDLSPSSVAYSDWDALCGLAPPHTDIENSHSSCSSPQPSIDLWAGTECFEEADDLSQLLGEALPEHPDGAAMIASASGSLLAESALDSKESLSIADAAGSSEEPTSVEATQSLTSRTTTRGKKRVRDQEDGLDYPATAGPSTKKVARNQRKEREAGPYPCTIDGCSSVFKNKHDRNRHIKRTKAHATRALKCPKCGVLILRMESFMRHFTCDDHAECRALFLQEMGAESLEECESWRVAEKFEVAYAPSEGSNQGS